MLERSPQLEPLTLPLLLVGATVELPGDGETRSGARRLLGDALLTAEGSQARAG